MRNLSLVFTQAWKAARCGAKVFGGKISEYLPEALRMAHAANRRNVTAKDLVKIMLGRELTIKKIKEEVNAKFKEQTDKNIARRIWNMFRSPYAHIEKIKCPTTRRCSYILKRVDKNFYTTSSILRALKMESKPAPKWVKPPLPMSAEEINTCRLANAFHRALTTGVFVAPQLA